MHCYNVFETNLYCVHSHVSTCFFVSSCIINTITHRARGTRTERERTHRGSRSLSSPEATTTHCNTPDLLPNEPITRNTKNGTTEPETLPSLNGNAKDRTPKASNVTKVPSNFSGVWPATTHTTHHFEATTTIAAMGSSTNIAGVPTTTSRTHNSESTTMWPNTGGGFKSYTTEPLSDSVTFFTSIIDTTVPKTPDMNGIVPIPRFPTTPPKSKGCGSNKTTTTELEVRARMDESREKSEQKYTNNSESNTMMAATESIFNVMANSTAPSKSTELEIRARMEASRVTDGVSRKQYRKAEREHREYRNVLNGTTPEKSANKYKPQLVRDTRRGGLPGSLVHYLENEKKYQTMTIKPKIDATVALHTHGGNILGPANAIPTDEDAQAVPFYKPKCKIVEGGIISIIPVKPNELSDNEKIEIVHIVGRCFATDAEMDTDDDMGDFSRKAAKVAHELIYNNSNETEIVEIVYRNEDPQTGETMSALAGVMILSKQTALWAHNTNAPNHKGREVRRRKVRRRSSRIKVYNLVQICILPEYRMRNLGHIALKLYPQISGADFLWWAGVETAYYDKYLHDWKKNPEMINLPFFLCNSEAENRKMFYYMEIGNKFQEEVTKFYNKDRNTRYYSLIVENKDIQEYYGSYDNNRDVKRPMTHTFEEKLLSRYTRHDGHSITIIIENTTAYYEDFEFSITSANITIVGQRKDKMGNTHKYNNFYRFEKPIQGYKCTGRYVGENFVITIAHD